MKKTLLLFVALFTTTMAFAQIKINNIFYNLNAGTQTAEVTYQSWRGNNYSGITSITIPEKVTYNATEYNVNSIGDYAFSGCSSLISITIGNSVNSIGDYAFEDCSFLTSIKIPNNINSIGDGVFYGCSSLTSIEIPNSVTSIGDYAFWNCSSLTSITIPNSVTSIEDYTFYSCSSLTSITIPNSVTSIGDFAFSDTPWLNNQPDGCVYINNCLYTYKGKMPANTHIDVKEGSTMICGSAFSNCSSLTSITIPNSVNSIGYRAFNNTQLVDNQPNGCVYINNCLYTYKGKMPANTHIDVKEGTTIICDLAFYDCSFLTSITIPNSVTSIGEMAFYNCSSLTSIKIPNNVNSIGDGVFHGCSSLTSIEIPNSVNSIGDGVFYGCSSLTSITIPNSVTSIGNSAFNRCSSLTSITIPNSVTSIGDFAFQLCSSLTSITIPNSVNSIGNYAFSSCSSLTSIDVDVNNPNYTSIDGILYNKDITTLIRCPETKNSVTINNNVISIENEAFCNCRFLNSITIPKYVITIGDYVFSGCRFLNSIDVDKNNQNFTSIEGVLYNKDITTLICCPKDKKSILIPNSVAFIGNNAFEHCFSLKSITIPNSVTSIGNAAFSDCKFLTSITIPKNVTSIGRYAFNSYLDTITCLSLIPPIANDLSANTKNCILRVQSEVYNDYVQHEYWGQFLNIEAIDPTNLETSKISSANIYTTNSTLHVEGATENYHILDAAGRLIYSGNATTLTLPRGIYLVTMGGEVEKIVL